MLRDKCSEHVLEIIQSLVSPERGFGGLGQVFADAVGEISELRLQRTLNFMLRW